MASKRRPPRVLLAASGGGHWVQLLRLLPAFDRCDTRFLCVDRAYFEQVPGRPCYVVNDANRWNKVGIAVLAIRTLLVILRARPDVVVSTGAAPGYFAVRFGKLLGARTVWLDSIANVERLSMSGRLARAHSDLWLTQWPHLESEDGPRFLGAVIS